MSYHTKRFPVLVTVKMSEAQHKRLKEKAKKLGISASEFIRGMIECK